MTTANTEPRPHGTGTVTQLAGGRFWARLPARHRRDSLGLFETRAEAEQVLAAALHELDGPRTGATLLYQFGVEVLREREASGLHRSVSRERDRWRLYVERAPIGALSVVGDEEITETAVRSWLTMIRKRDGRTIPSATTLSNALSLLRTVLQAAVEKERRSTNPAKDVTIPKAVRRASGATSRKWDWLRPNEIDRVLDDPRWPFASRTFWCLLIYTGMRPTELCALKWSCVDFELHHITIEASRDQYDEDGRRVGHNNPKNGESRVIAMLPPVAKALREWRAFTSAEGTRTHRDLIFPAKDGGCHRDGYDAGWKKHRAKMGFRRRVRLYDLRHTCASHLVQGTWSPHFVARPMRLEEVKEWLGHSDIKITQRYAHLCTDGINALVVRPAPASPPAPEEPELVVYEIPAEVAERAAVVAAQLVGSIGSLRRAAVVSELETFDPLVTGLVTTRSRLGDLNSGPTVYETVALPLS